jgi:hypothetical protein
MQPADAVPADLARQSKFQLLTRVGFAARGALYILIAFLLLKTGRTEDLNGALEYLGRGSGAVLLLLMAAGMATYALWRFSDAALGIENPGHDGKAYRKRAVAGVIGAIYLYLAYIAVRIFAGERSGGGTERQAGKVLDQPGGELMLYVAAAIMAVAGLNQFQTAFKCGFMNRLDPRARQPWVKWFGRLGYSARGIIFVAVAYLIAKAASEHSAAQAGGMEQALDALGGNLQYAVAAGLALFGAFSLIEARYRRLNEPDMANLNEVGEKSRR